MTVPDQHDRLLTAMDEIAGGLTAGSATVSDVLSRIVKAAVQSIDTADSASITLLSDDGVPFTSASTDEVAAGLDLVQYDSQDGPCLEVAATLEPAAGSGDLRTRAAWPVFAPAATDAGILAVLAIGLSHALERRRDEPPFGALNLYSTRPEAFTDEDREFGVVLASFAGVAVATATATAHAHHLGTALRSRDVIGQAKGILMERHRLTADQAFAVLRRSSSNLNLKLRDVAEHLARHRTLPDR